MIAERIVVIGAGAWGTALANVIARAGRTVTLFARDAALAGTIVARRESPRLPGVKLDDRVAVAAARGGQARRRCHSRRGAGADIARRGQRDCRRGRAGHPGRRLRQGDRARDKTIYDGNHRRMPAGGGAGDFVRAELCGRRRARPADRGDARRAGRGDREGARPFARLGDVPSLSFDRRARCRDRRRGEERARHRRRHRRRPQARRQRRARR